MPIEFSSTMGSIYLNSSAREVMELNLTNHSGNFTYWRWVAAEHLREWKEFPLTLTLFCILMSILSVGGSLANLFVALSFFFVPVLRKIQYAFIVNLTFIDLAITSVIMPLNVVNTVYGPSFWEGKTWACETVGSICGTICAASVWSIMAIALERYMCICHFSTHIRRFTRKWTIFWLLWIWIIANLIHMPNFVGFGHTSYAKDFYICTGDLQLASYSAFWAIFSVILPTIITFYAYLQIYLRVRVSQLGRNLIAGPRNTNPDNKKPARRPTLETVAGVDLRTEVKLVKALFWVFIIFLVSWLPVAVLFTINNGYTAPKWLNLTALILAHGNSASNSVVYFWLNNHLRESYATFARTKQRGTSVQPTMSQMERKSGRASSAVGGASRSRAP